MATTTTKGIDAKVGVAIGSAWGTMVDPAAGEALNFDQFAFSKTVARIQNNELTGTPMRKAGDSGLVTAGFSGTRKLHYQGDEIPLACIMGTAGNPSQVGTTDYYTHTLAQKQSLDGIFTSIAGDMENSIYEIPSAKWQSMTISGQAGGYVMVEYQAVGDDLDIAGDCTMASVTEDSNAALNFITFAEGSYRINAESGGALSGSDDPGIEGFSFQYTNPLATFTTSTNDPSIDEPVRDGFIECSGSLSFPTWTSANHSFLTALLAQTSQKLEIVFTSGSYTFTISVPRLILSGDVPSVGGPGRVPLSLNWEAEEAGSNPTGMSDTTPYLTVVSQLSTNPLA